MQTITVVTTTATSLSLVVTSLRTPIFSLDPFDQLANRTIHFFHVSLPILLRPMFSYAESIGLIIRYITLHNYEIGRTVYEHSEAQPRLKS